MRSDYEAAKAAQLRLTPVRLSLAFGTAPGGVKAALGLLGKSIGPCRSPVGLPVPEKLEKMRSLLINAGLLRPK
jgi:dihydrodipicolinate synthase/N-acetylneuraminate lyase